MSSPDRASADRAKEDKAKGRDLRSESLQQPEALAFTTLPGSPDRPDLRSRAAVMGLQRQVGNRAVARLFEGRAAARQIQRDTITLNPTVISNDPETERRLQAQSDAMMARFPEIWRGFCRDWFSAATAALASAPDPADPYAARNFLVALGGNMAWALTGLTVLASGPVGVGVGAVAVGTAMTGAAVGAGALAVAGPPSGRAAVGDALAAQRDKEELAGNRALFADVAQTCLDDLSLRENEDAQDRKLWQRFSASIPFEGRVAAMTTSARTKITSWLEQFQTQYLAWKEREDVIAKARDYELAEAASGPYANPIDVIADLIGVGTPADHFFEMAQRDIPFVPTFR